jgi:hypothetical protein
MKANRLKEMHQRDDCSVTWEKEIDFNAK